MIKRVFKIFLFCALFPPVSAPALKETDLSLLYKLLEEGEFYTTGDFPGEGGVTLRHAKFGAGRGRRGSLVFINGKGENIFKYMELFYDLHLQGWSPIYTYDHRGQGFSDRVLPDSTVVPVSLSPPEKGAEPQPDDPPPPLPGDVGGYDLYRKDLESFIRLVLGDPEADRSRLFLTAHSMGGAIALDYLQTHPETHPFQAVWLSTPMIKIKSGLFPLMETVTLKLLKGYCALLPCSWRFPSLRNRFTQKTLTDSKTRYAFSERLIKMFPQAESKGTSSRWIIESFKITDTLMEERRIRRINIPLAILQSEQEHFVSNEHQNRFCSAIPLCCRIIKNDGKHELFMERDHRRNRAVEEMTQFFINSPTHRKRCQAG